MMAYAKTETSNKTMFSIIVAVLFAIVNKTYYDDSTDGERQIYF